MVVVLMGAAGSGKTTVGRALSADAGWPYVEGDEHHPARNIEKMHAGISLTDDDRRPWLAALQNEDRDVWTQTSVASLARYQNHNYLLQALTVRLSLEPASPRSEQYRTYVLKVLADR